MARDTAKPSAKAQGEARSETISIRVDAETKAALERAAAEDDRTVSYLVQKIIREWLKTAKPE